MSDKSAVARLRELAEAEAQGKYPNGYLWHDELIDEDAPAPPIGTKMFGYFTYDDDSRLSVIGSSLAEWWTAIDPVTVLKLLDVVEAAQKCEQWGYGSDAPDSCKLDFVALRDALAALDGES